MLSPARDPPDARVARLMIALAIISFGSLQRSPSAVRSTGLHCRVTVRLRIVWEGGGGRRMQGLECAFTSCGPFTSFPNSVWERTFEKLRFVIRSKQSFGE
jgi:hypothetical protein